MFRLLLVVACLSLLSFSDPYLMKRISDPEFRYEFYTSNEIVSPNIHKVYYWFKGGAIHNAKGGIAGELLDGPFVKMYHSNQLAEQGKYSKGLRVGLWKSWYANGALKITQHWSNGLRKGKYQSYTEDGNLIETGKYSNDMKYGHWINFQTKDTTYFMKDEPIVEKPKLSKAEKERLKQEKKTKREAMKAQKAAEKLNKNTTKSNVNTKGSKVTSTVPKKEKSGFFSRLFSKKK